MTPKAMADLHARAFAGQGRAWSEAEFSDLLQSKGVFAFHALGGFALGRVSADEAEVLTIATDPTARRQGIGRHVLTLFEAEAKSQGARHIFLEVAQDNHAANGLYHQAGFQEIARRPGYYRKADGSLSDALVLKKPLA